MKSFFKKLAFVMAMAMVVSLAAPAAAQADELKPLYLSLQGTTDKVEDNITIAPDKTDLDFSFQGAQSGWLALLKESEGWKSSNPAVATVDGEGKVTPVAEGETVISYQLKGYEVAKTTVTVKAEEVVTPDEPEVTEPDVDVTVVDTKTVEIYAGAGTSKIKEADVELYRVFTSTIGEEVEVFWPIDVFTPDTTKDTVKVSPFVQYKDGEHYRLYIAGVEKPVDIYIVIPELEEVTHIELTFGSNEAANDKKATVAGVGQENEVSLSYKIMFGTMDVTTMFDEDIVVEYTVVSPDAESADAEKFEFDADNGTIVFDEKVKVTIQAVASYEDKDGKDAFLEPAFVTIEPTELPEYDFDQVVAWTIWDGSSEIKATDWYTTQTALNDVKEIPAGVNETYSIVLQVKDAYGDVWVTNAAAAAKCKPTAMKAISTSYLADEVWFEYKSTNTDLFLVDLSGDDFAAPYLTTYRGANEAIVYVELHRDVENAEETYVDTVYAFRFRIGEEKKFSALKVTGDCDISADALLGESDYVETKIKIQPVDQTKYGAKNFVVTNANYEITCSDEDGKAVFTKTLNSATGYMELDFNGYDLYAATGRTSLTYTVREKNSGISASFTIKLDKPNWRDSSREYGKLNGQMGYLAQAKNEEIKENNVGTGRFKYDLLIDQEGGYDKLSLAVSKNPVELGKHTGESDVSSTAFVAAATVKASLTSGNVEVGAYRGNDFEPITNAKWKEATGYDKGDRLYALYNSNKELLLTSATTGDLYKITNTDNSFNIQFTWTDNDKLGFAPAGDYTFVVYTVSDVDANGKIKSVVDASTIITVKDTVKDLTFNNREKIATSISDISTLEAVKEVVLEAFTFKLGNAVWGNTTDKILDGSVIKNVDYVENDDYIIIKKVEFLVPIDGTTTLTSGEDYYVKTVTLNMSVELGVIAE